MTANKKDPVLVVLQLSGAYDALNTVIPYEDPLYMDYRPVLKVEPEDVLPLDDKVGLHPAMAPVKELYDQGKVAVIQGIGYPNPIRSHFRSMDIWHTAVPEKMVTDGWLGRAIRELDPNKENVLTAVNFGRGLPRALAAPGVSVGLGGRPGELRGTHRDQGPGPEDRGPGRIRQDVLAPDRQRPGERLPVPDRTGRLEGRRHPRNRPRHLLLHRGVRRRPLLPVGEEHRPGAPGGVRHPHPLHRPRPGRLRLLTPTRQRLSPSYGPRCPTRQATCTTTSRSTMPTRRW